MEITIASLSGPCLWLGLAGSTYPVLTLQGQHLLHAPLPHTAGMRKTQGKYLLGHSVMDEVIASEVN